MNENQISSDTEANVMRTTEIENLFDSIRIIDRNDILKVILYFPFGLLLLVIRVITGILGFIILLVLPRTSHTKRIFKTVCKVLGLVVQTENKYSDGSAKLLIANHVSILDRIAVNMMLPCNIIDQNFEVKNTDFMSFWKDGDIQFHRELADDGRGILQKYIQDSNVPVLYFPEGATTNGKVGLLKFHPSVFSLDFALQPVLIRVCWSSFITISPSVLGSNTWYDIFWAFFLPCTYYTLRILPSMERLAQETPWDFSKRVQKTMADAMGFAPTVYTAADKHELLKRQKASVTDQHSSASQISADVSSVESELSFSTAAKQFGKTPKERMLSYQERKARLMEIAKIKYMQKHGHN